MPACAACGKTDATAEMKRRRKPEEIEYRCRDERQCVRRRLGKARPTRLAALLLTRSRWYALERAGLTTVLDGVPHALMTDPATGKEVLAPVRVAKTTASLRQVVKGTMEA